VTDPASVGGHGSRRLFCALTLPADVRTALVAWQRDTPHGDARPVAGANLHVTLAFLGSRPEHDVEPVAESLRSAVESLDGVPVLRPLRYRETRSVGMLVLEDEGGRVGRMAADLHARLEQLGLYAREARPWLPHLTVLRYRSPPRLRPPLSGLGAFSPSEAAVYHSLLRRGGAQYDVLASMSLGG
jgi:2'-5' RNA ligase